MNQNTASHTNQIMFLSGVVLITLAINLFVFWPFVLTLFTAMVFAVVVHPVYGHINNKINRRHLSSLSTLFLFLIVIFIPVSILSTIVVKEARNLYIKTQMTGSYIVQLEEAVQSKLVYLYPDVNVNIAEVVRAGTEWVFINTANIFSSVSTILLHLFIFLLALFYILVYSDSLIQKTIDTVPLSKERTKRILKELSTTIHAIAKGSFLLFFIRLICIAIIFTMFAIPNPIFWSILGSFIAIIPGIGTIFVIIPAVGFLLYANSILGAILLAIIGIILIVVIDMFVGPKLIEKGWHMHQFLILLSIIGGIIMIGPFGVFIGPIFLSLATVLLAEIPLLIREAEEKAR